MATINEKRTCKEKVRYSTDAAAQAALKKINPFKKLRRPARVYKCPVCNGFHLTSQHRKR